MAALFTLVFTIALPGPDGLGAPLITSTCLPGPPQMPFGGTNTLPACDSSLVALVVDAVILALIFVVVARVAGRTTGTAFAFGALLAVLGWAYLAAGSRSDRMVAWSGSLLIGALLAIIYSRLRRG
jgi:hypothetical protein